LAVRRRLLPINCRLQQGVDCGIVGSKRGKHFPFFDMVASMVPKPTQDASSDMTPSTVGPWTLPNALTLLRIFLVPLLVVFLLTEYTKVGLVIFLAASITDWFDGYLARRRHQVTTLGMLLDPIADKLLISTAFISLVELGLAPAWMVVIIVGRELAVTGLRTIAIEQGVTIPASSLGKYKMTAQTITVTLLILGPDSLGELAVLGEIGLWIVVILSLASAFQYTVAFWGRLGLGGEKSE
jgi:CDP-diacylglycerol--glycerol-3-phosphate 3-phosphatidyltransferase